MGKGIDLRHFLYRRLGDINFARCGCPCPLGLSESYHTLGFRGVDGKFVAREGKGAIVGVGGSLSVALKEITTDLA